MCINAGSESNSAMLTFDGVDVMGERLAKEVCYSFDIQSVHLLTTLLQSASCVGFHCLLTYMSVALNGFLYSILRC